MIRYKIDMKYNADKNNKTVLRKVHNIFFMKEEFMDF